MSARSKCAGSFASPSSPQPSGHADAQRARPAGARLEALAQGAGGAWLRDRCPLVACDRPAGDGCRELLDVADEPRHQPGPSRLASRLDRPRSVDVLRAGRASAARFGVLFGRREVLLVGIDDEHSKQARGLSVAGIFADAVMVARHFGKAVANALNFLRSVIDLASYRALQDRP